MTSNAAREGSARPFVALANRPILAAVLGALSIAFSAVLVRLSGASPATAAIFRCAYALPFLALFAWIERRAPGTNTLKTCTRAVRKIIAAMK